jgi:hypothetical protein
VPVRTLFLSAEGSPRREVERQEPEVGGVRGGEQVVGVLPAATLDLQRQLSGDTGDSA